MSHFLLPQKDTKNKMGIEYNTVLALGYEISYKQAKAMMTHPKAIKLAHDFGYDEDEDEDDFVDVWQELGFMTARPYYDASHEEMTFIIGIDLKDKTIAQIQKIDLKKAKEQLTANAEEFGLKVKGAPKLINLPDVL
jgi:hypothetical protein